MKEKDPGRTELEFTIKLTAHSSATKPIRRGIDFMRAQFQSSWKSKYDLKSKKNSLELLMQYFFNQTKFVLRILLLTCRLLRRRFPIVDSSFCHNGNNFQRKVSDYIVVYHREGFELEDS